MTVLAYGAEKEGEVHVSRLVDGVDGNGTASFDGLLVSRPDFDVQIVEIPRLPHAEVEGLLRYRLRSIYPGQPADTVFDFRTETDGARTQAVVFISRRATLDRFRAAARRKPLVFPYSVIAPIAAARRDLRVWFCHQGWAEHSVFRGGLLRSCTVFQGKKGKPPDLDDAEDELPSEVRELPVLVIASRPELVTLPARHGADAPAAASTLSFRELGAVGRNLDGLFGEPNRRRVLSSPAVRIAVLGCVVAALALLVLYRNVRQAEKRVERLASINTILRNQGREAVALQAEAEEMRTELSSIGAQRPADVYLLLSELTRVLGSEVRIRGLRVQEDGFQIEAFGANPLKVMERFQENVLFGPVKLSQVVPDPRSGRERFSFSGVLHAR